MSTDTPPTEPDTIEQAAEVLRLATPNATRVPDGYRAGPEFERRAFRLLAEALDAAGLLRDGSEPRYVPAVLDVQRDVRWYLHTGCRCPLQLPPDRRPKYCPNCDDHAVLAEAWIPLYVAAP